MLASRFAADYELLVQYGRSAAPDVAALADRRREAWALLDEVDALVDDSSKAVSRFAVLYARVVEGGRLTASEVEAIVEARVDVGIKALTLSATIASAVRSSPEARRRLDAIRRRAEKTTRWATVEGLLRFIIDWYRRWA